MNHYRGYAQISTGICNGRSVCQPLKDGRITISGTDHRGKPFNRVVDLVGGEIMDNCLRQVPAGEKRLKVVHRIAYGKFEAQLDGDGRKMLVRFAPGGTGKHGKSRRWEKLFGHHGVCHSWYKQGRLVRQKFIFDNGRTAYDWLSSNRHGLARVRDYSGTPVYVITGSLDGRQLWSGHSVLARPMTNWFLHSKPFSVVKYGRTVLAGQYRNSQKVGRWVEGGRTVFYEHGVAIPKKLYETPAEKLDPKALFKIDNAQLRMALLSKIKPERLAKVGRLIHKQRDMRLFDVPGMEVRILKVVCPSTKSVYHIRVPRDSTKCEEARQWTFHVNAGVRQPIKFAQET